MDMDTMVTAVTMEGTEADRVVAVMAAMFHTDNLD
jgi:hypothetical protein